MHCVIMLSANIVRAHVASRGTMGEKPQTQCPYGQMEAVGHNDFIHYGLLASYGIRNLCQ